MEKVIDKLHEISNDIYDFLNDVDYLPNGDFRVYGKIFHNEKDAGRYLQFVQEPLASYDDNGNVLGTLGNSEAHKKTIIDCRFDSVDSEIKRMIYDRICLLVSGFYAECDNEDDFLLTLGASINLYYIVGLYSTFGKFDVNKILKSIDSVDVKEYGNLINEFIYAKFINGINENWRRLEFEDLDLFKETIDKITENHENDGMESLYKAVKDEQENYIPDIYMAVKEKVCIAVKENAGINEAREKYYLDEILRKYPDFRFGLIYRCEEEALEFYKTGGQDTDVLKLKDKLGSDLFRHVIGLDALESVKVEVKNGKINVVRNELLSAFGMGIPGIRTVNERESRDKDDSSEESPVLIDDIRERTEKILGINVSVDVNDNPLSYSGILFSVVEQQRKELETSNMEIRRLNEQRGKLIDHLEHSWGNECYPEIVKNVADELLRNGEKSLANRLFKAYNSENNLMGQIIFLQTAMRDEPGALKKVFKDSFFISRNVDKKEWKIQSIIEEALENLVFSLLNYAGEKKKKNICKRKLCVKHTLEELSESYSKRFEAEENSVQEPFLQWFSENVFPVIVRADECWNAINFGKKQHGKIIMKNIFTELFTNVLFHGEEKCEIELSSTSDKMSIKMTNGISKETTAGTRRGLDSLKEVVAKLNYDTVVSEDEGLSYGKKTESIYETVVVFARELMYIDEGW